MNNEDDVVVGVIFGLLLGFLIAFIVFGVFNQDASHAALGARGHACFANNTCRQDLVCLHGPGAEPGTCAEKR